MAPDLPTDRDDAAWGNCVDAVAEAVGYADDVVVVGHSASGFLVPLVADHLGARLQVFVAGMVPLPDEAANEYAGHCANLSTPDELAAILVGYLN